MKNKTPLRVLTIAACVALGCTLAQAAPPQFDATIPPQTIPAGKVVLVPVTASLSGTAAGSIQYFVSSDNKSILVRAKTGNPNLKLHITYAGDGNAAPFDGDLQFHLFGDFTPHTAAIIAGLAQGGFYDGLQLFRIASLDGSADPGSYIAQGGDPQNSGQGGPGFSFDNEFQPAMIFTGKGQLAMANAGYDFGGTFEATNGSQFFITNGQQRALDFNHTIFAQLLRGFDVLTQIVAVPTNPADDKPTVDVIIESAQVVPNPTDAVLYLSALTTGSANISVKIWDGKTFAPDGKTPLLTGTTFAAVCEDDSTNDPPFIVPQADAVTPMNTPLTLTFKGIDLESDYLTFGSAQISGTNIATLASPASGNPITVNPKTGFTGPVDFVAGVQQLNATSRGSTQNPFDLTTVVVGVGDRQLTAGGVTLHTEPNTPLVNQIVANFTDLDMAALSSQFTATINWGDGTALSTGTGVTITTGTASSNSKTAPFVVKGAHTYAHTGSFPVTVVIGDSVGATATAYSTALSSTNAIVAQGVSAIANGSFNGTLATFTGPNGLTDASYSASIDWGDGTASAGRIKMNNPPVPGFSVSGSHKYPDAEPYTACVKITGTGSDNTTVWSSLQPSSGKVSAHLPPFSQTHLVGAFISNLTVDVTGTGASLQEYVKGSLVVINSGKKTSSLASIRYYLSADKVLSTGTNGDTLLKINPNNSSTSFPLFPFSSGHGQQIDLHPAGPPPPPTTTPLTDTRLPLPLGVEGKGMFIIVEMVYTDPLTDHQAVSKTFVSGAIQ